MQKTLATLIVATLIFVGCKPSTQPYSKIEGAMLGTNLRVVADVECPPSEFYAAAMRLDSIFKSEMSLFDPDSQLNRINRGESDSLSPGIAYNLHLSDSVSRISSGAYDITVAPLVKALGFGAESDQQQHPNIDSILEFVGYQKINVVGNRLIRQDIRTQIDLNSIAKGYVVDRLGELTTELGAKNFMVDIGGEIVCRGVNPYGDPWRIGIESPFDGNMSNGDYLQKRLAIAPDSPFRAMATSGNYRRYYLDDEGNKVAHTIDASTGRSKLSSLLSVTVIAPTCALADAYGTMFMALGSDAAIEMAEQLVDAEVYFIFDDGQGGYREYLSEEMRSLVIE
ncbi:MAG: FAD:protein FMN transferase [Rikenellaceae bacterium]